MNTSVNKCLLAVLASIVTGIVAFVLSFLNVFSFTYIQQFLILAAVFGAVMGIILFGVLTFADKTRLIREAVCCCGKVALIGFAGTTITALLTLLLYNGTVRVLLDLGIGFTFLFLTMIVLGIACIITTIYQCGHHNNC